jgi:hypothetical protein
MKRRWLCAVLVALCGCVTEYGSMHPAAEHPEAQDEWIQERRCFIFPFFPLTATLYHCESSGGWPTCKEVKRVSPPDSDARPGRAFPSE